MVRAPPDRRVRAAGGRFVLRRHRARCVADRRGALVAPSRVREAVRRAARAGTAPRCGGSDDVAAHQPLADVAPVPALLAKAESADGPLADGASAARPLSRPTGRSRRPRPARWIPAGSMRSRSRASRWTSPVTRRWSTGVPWGSSMRRPTRRLTRRRSVHRRTVRPRILRRLPPPTRRSASTSSAAPPRCWPTTGTAWPRRPVGREDLAVDRFRSGPRRERARELNRPTRPPTPARTGPGGTPREVLVTRRRADRLRVCTRAGPGARRARSRPGRSDPGRRPRTDRPRTDR